MVQTAEQCPEVRVCFRAIRRLRPFAARSGFSGLTSTYAVGWCYDLA
jgi:hypothetical protein